MTRTRSFDEEALLDAAIDVFWVEGYRGASLSVLSQKAARRCRCRGPRT